MPAKKRGVSRRQTTSRYVTILEWSPSLFIRVEKPIQQHLEGGQSLLPIDHVISLHLAPKSRQQ